MADLTWQGAVSALLFLTAAAGLAAALWAGVDALRKLTGADRRRAARSQTESRLRALENRMAACEASLSRDEMRFSFMHQDLTQALTALNALLMHEITGNSIDRLKTVKSSLDAYLSGRREKGEAP